MKAKALLVVILACMLTGIIALGSVLQVDYDFIAKLTEEEKEVAQLEVVDNPCLAEEKTEAIEFICETNEGDYSNEDIAGKVRQSQYQTGDISDTEEYLQEINDTYSDVAQEDNISNGNPSIGEVGNVVDGGDDVLESSGGGLIGGLLDKLSDLQSQQEDAVDVSVFYLENSEIPVGVDPTTEILEDYANLFVYDYYEGDITNNDGRVFIDDRKYDETEIGMQAVYLNVLEPSGRLTEYRMDLNTVENTNQFDVTAPVINVDSNLLKLTQDQFDNASDEELVQILVTQLHMSIIDDYDGDLTSSDNVSFTKIEKSFETNSGIGHQIEMKVFDSKFNYSSIMFDVIIEEKVDMDAPIISGNNEIYLYDESIAINDFERLGLTAFDSIDGDLTNQIQILDDGGYVPGEYGNFNVIYTVKDSSGNSSIPFEYTIRNGKNISTCSDLNTVNEGLDLVYRVTEDIDCNGFTIMPIATRFDSFTGVFDGGGFEIANLEITPNSSGYGGLFASNSGVIQNLHLNNVTSTGSINVGGLVAYNSGDIKNVSVKGNVDASGSVSVVGGLVGFNTGDITNAYFRGDVSGYFKVGGLVGESSYGSVNNSYSFANILGDKTVAKVSQNYAGGTIGKSQATKVSNALAVSNIESNYFDVVGGIIGSSQQDNIVNTYSAVDGYALTNSGVITGMQKATEYTNNFTSAVTSTNPNESEEFTSKTLVGMDFADVLFNEAVIQSNWDYTDSSYPLLKYTDVNGFGTGNLMRGQLDNDFVAPDLGDVTTIPEIIGEDNLEVEITETIDLTDIEALGLQAFDSFGEDITKDIYLSNANGFKNDVAGVYDIEYLVTDSYGRESDVFVLSVSIIDTTPPTIIGPNEVEVNQSEKLDIYDPSVMGLVSYDQNTLFTNRIKVVDAGGFKGDGTDEVGKYNVIYQVEDASGNKSDPHIILINVVKNIIEISTCDELQSIGKVDSYNGDASKNFPANGNYLITKDLDCSTNNITSSQYFDAITLDSGAIIDGGNHTVKNVELNDQHDYTAMFKKVEDSTIKNLKIEDAKIEGKNYTALLIGEAFGDVMIDNVTINAEVSAKDKSSFVIGKIDRDAEVIIENSIINGVFEGVKDNGVLVGELAGNIELNLNKINVEMFVEEISQFNIIGSMTSELPNNELEKRIEKIISKNFIEISNNLVSDDGTITPGIDNINSEAGTVVDDDDLLDDNIENVNVEDLDENIIEQSDSSFEQDIVDDEPIPIN